jgi:pyruvate formate lyase activating enzyme
LIQNGEDFCEIQEILDMIHSSEPFISGVVFSGGEPTMQKEALVALCGDVKKMNLAVGIQTNGLFPETLAELIAKKTVDKVAVDYKTRWEQYTDHWKGFQNIKKENYQKSVRESIKICKKAYNDKILPEFEVVVTVFYGNEKDIIDISKEIGDIDLIIQQGEHKLGFIYSPLHAISELEYLNHKKSIREDFQPLTDEEIKKFADNLKRPVRIRTRNAGEIFYEGHRGRRASRKR